MQGSIKQRGDNSWRIRIFTGYDEKGKQLYITKTVRGKKKDADAAARAIIDDLGKGLYKKPQKITLAQYMRTYMETTAKLINALPTQHRYNEIVDLHLAPSLGAIEIQQLTTTDIRQYYAEALESGNRQSVGKGLSKRTILHHHRLLHKILEQAVEDNLIAVNPATKKIAPKVDDNAEMNIITPDEAEIFLKTANSCKYLECIKFALQTGMRRGEISACKFSDINWENSTLSINRGLSDIEGIRGERSTKTRAGRRIIELMPTTMDLLKQAKATQAQNRLFFEEAFTNHDYIFCEANGEPMHLDALTHSFMWYRNKAGLKITFHDLRHCHASYLLAAGVHPKIVSERLGHSSIQITMDLYSHLLPSLQAAGVAKLQELVGYKIA